MDGPDQYIFKFKAALYDAPHAHKCVYDDKTIFLEVILKQKSCRFESRETSMKNSYFNDELLK